MELEANQPSPGASITPGDPMNIAGFESLIGDAGLEQFDGGDPEDRTAEARSRTPDDRTPTDEKPSDEDVDAAEELVDEDEGESEEAEAEEPEETEETEETETQELELAPEELASLLGADKDTLVIDDEGQVKISVKVNGEQHEVNLEELRQGYSRDSDYRRKTQALAEERQQFTNHAAQQLQAVEQELYGLQSLKEALVQEWIGEQYSDQRLAELEQDDPGMAALERQKRNDAIQKLDKAMQAVNAVAQRTSQQQYQMQQQEFNERAAKELQKYHEVFPHWFDKGGEQARAALGTYMLNNGVSQEEIKKTYDHRILLMAEKAMKYDELIAGKKELPKKRRVRIPKVQKPGTTRSKTEVKADAQRQRMQKHRSSGSIDSAVDFLLGSDLV